MHKKIFITTLSLITAVTLTLGAVPARAAVDPASPLGEKLFEAGRTLIVGVYDLVVQHYGNLNAKVSSNNDLTSDEKSRLLAVINPAKDYFTGRKDLVVRAEDQEALTALTQADKVKWDEYQTDLRQVEGEIFYSRVEAAKAKLDLLADGSRDVSELLAGFGKDTSRLDELIREYEAKIAEAESSAKAGVDVYRTIINLKDLPKLADALDNLVVAWDKLEQARLVLEEMLREAQRLLSA